MSQEEPRQGAPDPTPVGGDCRIKLTVGEALEATAHTVGDKAVEQSDAAAIGAAEMRAAGRSEITEGGVAAAAQKAAAYNTGCVREEDKIKMRDIVSRATVRLPADKEATRQDAVEVAGAELGNSPNVSTTRGGVAASVATAARLNENPSYHQ